MTSQTLPGSAPSGPPGGTNVPQRQWARALALAGPGVLDAAWREWEPKPEVQAIRGPEAGLVMVRARADGGGARFNLGEATITRATVRLHGGPLSADTMGTAYVLGTDTGHALHAAIFHGLLADGTQRERVLAEIIAPLEREQAARDADRQADARSTRVDFFSVAREHE